MAIAIRRLRVGEEALANDFFNGVYKSNRSLEDFKWEFVNGPEGPAIYVIAVDESFVQEVKVVGIQCAIPLKLQDASGDAVLTAKSEDTLVDPAYRGQRIFERMYEVLFDECAKAGISCIWGFTPAKKAFERIGFEIPFMAHQALRVFRPLRAYSYLSSLNPGNRTVDRIKIAALAVVSNVLSVVKGKDPSNALTVRKAATNTLLPAMSELLRGTPWYYLRMDEKYLAWRMANNPFNNRYESVEFLQGDHLVAAAIVNFRPERFAYIEQVVFASNASESSKRDVLLHLVKIMKPRADFIRTLCFDTNQVLKEQETLFQRSGFVVMERGSFFVWKSLVDSGLDPRRVFLTRLFTQGNQ